MTYMERKSGHSGLASWTCICGWFRGHKRHFQIRKHCHLGERNKYWYGKPRICFPTNQFTETEARSKIVEMFDSAPVLGFGFGIFIPFFTWMCTAISLGSQTQWSMPPLTFGDESILISNFPFHISYYLCRFFRSLFQQFHYSHSFPPSNGKWWICEIKYVTFGQRQIYHLCYYTQMR